MNICDTIDLGSFNYCEGVIIEDPSIVEPVTLESITTKFTCEFTGGDFGMLGVGIYVFTYDSVNYIFKVI